MYDYLIEGEGKNFIFAPFANYAAYNLDCCSEMMQSPHTLIGLGDGGAHYGLVCDSSYPTFMLGHWARDRKRGGFTISEAVRMMSSVQADFMGFTDRGRLEVGRRADINVIDVDKVRMHAPSVLYDLPGGGRRVDQLADGYSATIVGGKVIQRNGTPTGELPGRLVRAGRASAMAEAAE